MISLKYFNTIIFVSSSEFVPGYSRYFLIPWVGLHIMYLIFQIDYDLLWAIAYFVSPPLYLLLILSCCKVCSRIVLCVSRKISPTRITFLLAGLNMAFRINQFWSFIYCWTMNNIAFILCPLCVLKSSTVTQGFLIILDFAYIQLTRKFLQKKFSILQAKIYVVCLRIANWHRALWYPYVSFVE